MKINILFAHKSLFFIIFMNLITVKNAQKLIKRKIYSRKLFICCCCGGKVTFQRKCIKNSLNFDFRRRPQSHFPTH